jgi:hypothetical protein
VEISVSVETFGFAVMVALHSYFVVFWNQLITGFDSVNHSVLKE